MIIKVNKAALVAVINKQVDIPGLNESSEGGLLLSAVNAGCEAIVYAEERFDVPFVRIESDMGVLEIEIIESEVADAINNVVDIPWVGESAEGMIIINALSSLTKAATELVEKFDLTDVLTVEEE